MAPECATTEIPAHRHYVTLGLFHSQMQIDYGIAASMQLSVSLPYDVKKTEVRYSTLGGEAFDPPYGDIHHRDETLTGFSDAEIMLRYQPLASFGAGTWQLGAGLTAPIGETTEDPVRLGQLGLPHQHIQFGSGTVNPKLALRWTRPAGRALLSAALESRLSITENDQGFRAPTSTRWAIGPAFTVGGFGVSGSVIGEYQTIGRWNGQIDEGTGFNTGGLRLQASRSFGDWMLAPHLYVELYARGLHHEESFSQSPTLGLMISRTIRRPQIE